MIERSVMRIFTSNKTNSNEVKVGVEFSTDARPPIYMIARNSADAEIVRHASRWMPPECETPHFPYPTGLPRDHSLCTSISGSVSARRQVVMIRRRAFSVAGPMVWNSLPDFLRDTSLSKDTFRRSLKTYFFCIVLKHISALEALRNALYKFSTYLLTYYPVMCQFPLLIALCDHSQPTLQTDRQTDVMLVAYGLWR